MLALFAARRAAIGSAYERHCKFSIRSLAALVVATGSLSACMPAGVPLAGADPADPAAKVAGVGYRSTIGPYTSMRPSDPAPWRQGNDGLKPKSDR